MAEQWTEWGIDREAGELVGPCGCRAPNTLDGMKQARKHTCVTPPTSTKLDQGALVMADLAWVETEGSAADRTKAAIQAYLWAVKIADETGLYPSLDAWRATVTPLASTEGGA